MQYSALFGRVRCGGASFCYTVGNMWAGPGSLRWIIMEVPAGTLRSGRRLEAEESRLIKRLSADEEHRHARLHRRRNEAGLRDPQV